MPVGLLVGPNVVGEEVAVKTGTEVLETVPEGTVDGCELGALDVVLGVADGEPVELTLGPVDGCATGSADGTTIEVEVASVGAADGPADGFALGADMAVAAG